VRLNPNTNQIGVSIENSSNVYNGTFRFTINKGGAGATVFHLQDAAKWDQIELHASGEEMGTGGLLWDVPEGTTVNYYGEVLLLNVASHIYGNFESLGSFTKVNIAPRTPGSSSAPCNTGDYEQDSSYIYVCTSNNRWRRAALADF
jgi:hypothetical protein